MSKGENYGRNPDRDILWKDLKAAVTNGMSLKSHPISIEKASAESKGSEREREVK
jgi:hypothetical protein